MNYETLTGEEKPCYFIDLEWYEENNRSFHAFVQSRLCPSCQNRLKAKQDEGEPLESFFDPFMTIGDCCSRAPNFITPKLPLMETVFRIFLANGNQPLSAEEICQREKNERGEATAITLEALRRMLEKDRYYGLRVKEPESSVKDVETGESP